MNALGIASMNCHLLLLHNLNISLICMIMYAFEIVNFPLVTRPLTGLHLTIEAFQCSIITKLFKQLISTTREMRISFSPFVL